MSLLNDALRVEKRPPPSATGCLLLDVAIDAALNADSHVFIRCYVYKAVAKGSRAQPHLRGKLKLAKRDTASPTS